MTQKTEVVPSILALDRHKQLLILNKDGHQEKIVAPESISQISTSIEGTIWLLAEHRSGANGKLYYSDNAGISWQDIELSMLRIANISASHVGGCFITTPVGSVYFIAKSGDIEQVFNEGVANSISVSPDGYVWVLSREKKPGGGNLIFWCSINNFGLQPVYGQPVAKRISAGIDGTARIVTVGGEVGSLYLNRMGGLEPQGGVEFAKDIAASLTSSTIWTICPDVKKKRKGNTLMYWNPDKDEYLKWHTVPGFDPIKIACMN